jgi:recombination protein RecR
MLPTQIQRVIQELSRLPGIGPKSAERLAFHLLKKPKDQVGQLAEAIGNLKEGIMYCRQCCNLSDLEVCRICDNSSRDRQQICIVEEPMDVFALENSGAYKGLYHVLHGAISPLDGIGPDQLTVDAFLKRLEADSYQEVILATNPNVTGEATSIYITRLLKPRNIRITHLAQGLPMGGELEFADPDTLKRAMMGRRE